MKTLFPDNFSWAFYVLCIIFLRVFFTGLSWYSFFALCIAIWQFILLFNSVGNIIPTRYLLGTLMCVQFFIGPVLAYNGLDDYQYFQYKMKIPEENYFSYAIPAVFLFIIGLHLNAGMNRGEIPNQKKISNFVKQNPSMAYQFIIVGFAANFIGGFFGSELAFLFYLLGSFNFIGLFLIILGDNKIKPLPMVLVIGSILIPSLNSGMFHDLLTWTIYTASVYGIKHKFSIGTKIGGLVVFSLIAATIQVLKADFRKELSSGQSSNSAEAFSKTFKSTESRGGVLSFNNLAASNVRINQGFIVTNIMYMVPDKVDYANGEELYAILEAAFLPRIFAPNKLNAGDRTLFTKYSGIPLKEGTSMGLSSMGDAYINFGIFGGCIFMFILGLVYSEVLNFFYKQSLVYPVLILFTALIFYYPIRPDCELQTILGHLVKSSFLVFFLIQIWNSKFKERQFAV